MLSFEKYRRWYLLEFLIDIGISCITACVFFLCFTQHVPLGRYFSGILTVVLLFGVFRLVLLLKWLLRSLVLRYVWLSIFSGIHLIILSVCLWWTLFFLMLFSGIIGITPDGTEHRY